MVYAPIEFPEEELSTVPELKQQISEDIWSMKYRQGSESLVDFYKRQADALDIDGIYEQLAQQKLCLGGRSQYALGTKFKGQTLSGCFVVKIANDSMEAILDVQKEFGLTMKAGGGVGCNFSVLRPRGASINTTSSSSSGVTSFLRGFDAWCDTIEAGGDRRGAMNAILDIWHPEVINFIKAKREKGKLNNFNISVAISDRFMEAVDNDEDWNLVFPDTTDEDYDSWDGDLDEWYSKGKEAKVYQTIKACELFDLIMESNYDYAEPGVLFLDTINESNNVSYWGTIRATNPCGEQPLLPYESCNLGAINLTQFVETNPHFENTLINIRELKETVRYGVRALNKILDINNFPLQKYEDTTQQLRPIGLGIMGFGSMLNMLGIRYDSSEAREKATWLGQIIANEAYKESAKMAKEDGAFPAFRKEKFLKSKFIQRIDIAIRDMISKYGIRNSRLLTIAPTGTTAILANNVSGGLEPLFNLEYNREIRQSDGTKRKEKVMDYSWYLHCEDYKHKTHIPVPDHFNATATEITPEAHIDIQSAWQYWIDASISKTTNVPKDISFEDFKDIYKYAYKMNLKGCTTYRPNDIVGSVLSTDSEESEKSEKSKESEKSLTSKDVMNPFANLIEIQLSPLEPAMRHIVLWKNKAKLYIVVTITEDGYPLEVFTKLPKEAGNGLHQFELVQFAEFTSNWDAICRHTSTLLRYGIDLQEIIKQLDKSAYSMFDCSAILARELKKYPMNVHISIERPEDLEELEEEDKEDYPEELFYDEDKEGVNETLQSKEEETQCKDRLAIICPECGLEDTLVKSGGCDTCLTCGYSKCS